LIRYDILLGENNQNINQSSQFTMTREGREKQLNKDKGEKRNK